MSNGGRVTLSGSLELLDRGRRFLRFIWKGQAYAYTALPFGLSASPSCFTKVMKPVVRCLRAEGIRVVFYLDDILLLVGSEANAVQ